MPTKNLNAPKKSTSLRKSSVGFSAKIEHDKAIKLLENGSYGEAIKAYDKILEHDPKQKSAHYYIAVARVKSDDHNGAMEALDRALDLDDKYLEANVYLGVLHCISGDHRDSIDYFERAKATGSTEMGEMFDILEGQGMLEGNEKAKATAVTEMLLSNPELLGMEMELEGL